MTVVHDTVICRYMDIPSGLASELTDDRHIPKSDGVVGYGMANLGDQVMSRSLPKEDKS